MAANIASPVPLSTPDNNILREIGSIKSTSRSYEISDEEFSIQFEIARTLQEIKLNKWHKVALQFPDELLPDSARVYQLLARGYELDRSLPTSTAKPIHLQSPSCGPDITKLSVKENTSDNLPRSLKLTILADTSYGSCCVDEVAAEHVDAEVVVHYGRTCLSATSRLPVIYVYTKRPLQHFAMLEAFKVVFPDKTSKVICMADIPYSHHVGEFCAQLKDVGGYENIFATQIVRDNGCLLPNRTLPEEVRSEDNEESMKAALRDWSIFHVSDPPTSLLLTLESQVKAVHIFSVPQTSSALTAIATQINTAQTLRRRYALVTSLATVSVWGILINTLSVRNYLDVVDHLKKTIGAAGKKSYLFVVGKLNPAKVANFADIGGWVVVGCWESSLIDSRDFYRPIITPFELDLVLRKDNERIWTGEWRGDFGQVLSQFQPAEGKKEDTKFDMMPGAFLEDSEASEDNDNDIDSDKESAPPEFDLRTGRYVSTSQRMRTTANHLPDQGREGTKLSTALTKSANGDMLKINGISSPAAEFLANERTWRGLGSDFEVRYDSDEEQGGMIEEGLTGIASGYSIGDSQRA